MWKPQRSYATSDNLLRKEKEKPNREADHPVILFAMISLAFIILVTLTISNCNTLCQQDWDSAGVSLS